MEGRTLALRVTAPAAGEVNLTGDDVERAARGAILARVRAVLEASHDGDARALQQVLGNRLAPLAKQRHVEPVRVLLALVAGSLQAAPAETSRQAECAVWQRELSFAGSVADHDATAFAEHLHPQAVFGVSGKPTRGREAITREWAA